MGGEELVGKHSRLIVCLGYAKHDYVLIMQKVRLGGMQSTPIDCDAIKALLEKSQFLLEIEVVTSWQIIRFVHSWPRDFVRGYFVITLL